MWKYFDNPFFWKLDWTLSSIAPKFWFLPLLAALATLHFRERTHRHVLSFVGFSVLMDFITSEKDLSSLLNPNSNGPLYHIFGPFLFAFLWQIFADYLVPGKKGLLRWWPVILYAVLALANAIWGDGFNSFPTITVGLYSFAGIIFCVTYFFSLLRHPSVFYLERLPMFWVSTGFLIYFAGNALLWAGLSFITYDRAFFSSIYRINGVVTIFLNLTLTIAIFLNPAHETQTISPKTFS